MNKLSYVIVFIAIAFFASCKSKKNLVPVSTNNSAPATTDVQYDAYRNKIPGAQVERVDKSVKVTFDSEVLFPTNSSYLTEQAKDNLTKLAEVVKQQGDVKIQVAGHTDKTGTPEYNKWLSDKRAVSVKTFIAGLGVPEANISTIGMGDTKPVADNRTPEGRAKNRRVEITITPVK